MRERDDFRDGIAEPHGDGAFQRERRRICDAECHRERVSVRVRVAQRVAVDRRHGLCNADADSVGDGDGDCVGLVIRHLHVVGLVDVDFCSD